MQPYCGIWKPCVTLAYSRPSHIQNLGKFRIQGIFRTLSNHIMAYSERSTYWTPYHIQNFAIFKILAYLGLEAYLEPFLFSHIRAYLGIFNIDSYNNVNVPFFALILHTFQRNLKRHINKHNQKLISILKNQKIYEGFLKILIFRVSLSRTHLQSKTFLFKAKNWNFLKLP